MDYGRLKTEYLCYLMNRAQVEAEGDRGYLRLCEKLQETEFIPILEMDENRCGECRELRRDFAETEWDYLTYMDETPVDILDGTYGENGTMMEMLVVLAEKMNFDLADSQYEAGIGHWFRELLENCGLIEYTNETLEDGRYAEAAADILDTVIFRKYGWDGEGSLFPLRWPKQDQRYQELIVQMNGYIEENYDIC